MFDFFKKRRLRRIANYTNAARNYIKQKYTEPEKPLFESSPEKAPSRPSGVKFSVSGTRVTDNNNIRYSERDSTDEPFKNDSSSGNVRYSLKETDSSDRYSIDSDTDDRYNASKVSNVLRNYSATTNINATIQSLEQNINQTFVDKLLQYIREKGLRESAVYKSAQVDKRLFSRIISNHEYRPSKDTAIALSLALKLSLHEANDMLSRAGYTFSHSNMRDIVIEFFFREKIYNLFDLNEVLDNLNLKLIGRF